MIHTIFRRLAGFAVLFANLFGKKAKPDHCGKVALLAILAFLGILELFTINFGVVRRISFGGKLGT